MNKQTRITPELIEEIFVLKQRIEELEQSEAARKRAEEALQKSEATAKRLAQENDLVAEIGRIISSTLNIDEVYERFAEKVREIIPFDIITINILNARDNTWTIRYNAGMPIKGRKIGDVAPLDGSMTERIVRTRSSLLMNAKNRKEMLREFPRMVHTITAKIRSMMGIPLISKDEVIGILSLRSVKRDAYTVGDLRLAEKVGSQIAGAIANAQLFLEHKKAEEALQKNNLDLMAIIDNLPFLAWLKDCEGRFIAVNEQFARSCGLPAAKDLVGKTDLDIWPKHLAEAYRADDFEVIRTRRKKAVEEFVADQGVEKWFETYKAPLYDVNGNITGTTGIARDITERKEAEEALQKSEEKFRELVENINDVFYELDGQGIIQYVSPSVEYIFGYSRAATIGRSITDFLDPEYTASAVKNVQNVMAGDMAPHEYRIRSKSGDIAWIRVSSSPLRQGDRVVGVRGVMSDITHRKQAEEEKQNLEERLHRAEKMEALGTLAGGVAHDLNNVLGVLMGYTEMLMEEIPEGDTSRIYVDNILKSAEKGASIIQDLLTLARRGVSVAKVMNLNDIISDFLKSPVLEKLQSYHPRVSFRTELDTSLFNIKGSPVHLEKAAMNLISNAAEAIAESGEVMIRTENRYLDRAIRGYDQVKEGEYVVLMVSDNGSGIEADDLGKIFEPFYTKKIMGRSGTGLGLAVIWGTVKDHSGYIDVESEYGQGSTFTLYFPVTREEAGADLQKIPAAEYRGKGETILVVDDVEAQREMAAAMLTKLGYQVRTVSRGEEAVEYLKTHRADLLVLDMIMDPGLDGLETYRRIREINPVQRAILVSGFSETDQVKAAQELGAGAYVKKPYMAEKIGLAVRKELDRSP